MHFGSIHKLHLQFVGSGLVDGSPCLVYILERHSLFIEQRCLRVLDALFLSNCDRFARFIEVLKVGLHSGLKERVLLIVSFLDAEQLHV